MAKTSLACSLSEQKKTNDVANVNANVIFVETADPQKQIYNLKISNRYC